MQNEEAIIFISETKIEEIFLQGIGKKPKFENKV
jgi:hypothetical protein